MGIGDGQVLGSVKILDHGSNACRWNLVIVGDGYTQHELSGFASDADALAEQLLCFPPFDESIGGKLLSDAMNIHRLDVESHESGADDPSACGGSGASVATYFDASFCNSGLRRLLLVDTALVIQAVELHVPEFHAIVVLVNSPLYGGSGGTVSVISRANGAYRIAFHELGHSAFGLADEYEYWQGCGAETTQNHHPASEPCEPNVTIDGNAATIKWAGLITPGTAVPTTANADCTICDPQPSPLALATVGAFEGARYFHCDVYRPEFHCMMRSLGQRFCAVCRQRIITTLEPYLP
jgi:hypothetical protein